MLDQQTIWDFLKYSVSPDFQLENKDIDFEGLYKFAGEHAMLGILFKGVEKLPEEIMSLHKDLFLKWYADYYNIVNANKRINANCIEVSGYFARKGFRSCLLKGQGNTLYYPDCYARTPGDIDLWLEGGDEAVLDFVRRKIPSVKYCYHHCDFASYKGVGVELHYRPSFVNDIIGNRSLQAYFERNSESQFGNFVNLPGGEGRVAVPTVVFSVIYQLAHIATHVFRSGIGLRQLLDYYYLLQNGLTSEEKRQIVEILDEAHLSGVARAVMYVENVCFGLSEKYMYVQPDVKSGKVLLNDILHAGNFGSKDTRFFSNSSNVVVKNINRLVHDMSLASSFPREALAEPLFRVYHYMWRVKKRNIKHK